MCTAEYRYLVAYRVLSQNREQQGCLQMCLNFWQREVKHCVDLQRQDHVLQQVQHQHCGRNKQNKIFSNSEVVVWPLKGVSPFQRFGYMKLESCAKTAQKK